MKLKMLSLAIASVFAGMAQNTVAAPGPTNATLLSGASLPTVTLADAAHTITLAGASAQDTAIAKLLQNNICTSDFKVFKDSHSDDDAGNGTKQDTRYWGGRWTVYSCTAKAAGTYGNVVVPASLGGHVLTVYKRSAGGSGMGLVSQLNNPDLFNTPIQLNFMAPTSASCNYADTANTFTFGCKAHENVYNASNDGINGGLNVVLKDVQTGVLDTNPELYAGINAVLDLAGTSVDPSDIATVSISPAAAVPFGIPVTNGLYTALQNAQIAGGQLASTCAGNYTLASCIPSLSKSQVATIASGQLQTWDQFFVNGTPLTAAAFGTAPTDKRVHFCQRTQGSGTAAGFYAKILNNCGGAGLQPAADGGAAGPAVHAVYETVDMEACLDDVDQGNQTAKDYPAGNYVLAGTGSSYKAWGIGQIAADKNAKGGSWNYKFVKLDGQLPEENAVFSGKYTFWTTSTWVTNPRTPVAGTPAADLATLLISNAKTAAALSNTSKDQGWGKVTYFGLPENNVVTATYAAAKPVIPFTHAGTGNLDLCSIPVAKPIPTNEPTAILPLQ